MGKTITKRYVWLNTKCVKDVACTVMFQCLQDVCFIDHGLRKGEAQNQVILGRYIKVTNSEVKGSNKQKKISYNLESKTKGNYYSVIKNESKIKGSIERVNNRSKNTKCKRPHLPYANNKQDKTKSPGSNCNNTDTLNQDKKYKQKLNNRRLGRKTSKSARENKKQSREKLKIACVNIGGRLKNACDEIELLLARENNDILLGVETHVREGSSNIRF